MTDKPTWEQIQRERDERVSIPLGLGGALAGLLKVDPEDEPEDEDTSGSSGSAKDKRSR